MLLLADHIDIVDPNAPPATNSSSISLADTSQQNQTYAGLLADYSFLYGAIPTAPSVAIYAARYRFEVDMVSVFHLFFSKSKSRFCLSHLLDDSK